jgi:alpha-mannosidase
MLELAKKLETERIKQAKHFSKRLSNMILGGNLPFTAEYHKSKDPIPLKESIKLQRTPIAEGAIWGEAWDSGYFRLTGTVPADWKGQKVVAVLDFTGEALVYSKDGVPLYGLTSGSVFTLGYEKSVYRIFEPCRGNEHVELLVETAANGLFGVNRNPGPDRQDPTRHGTYNGVAKRMRLCTFDEALWHFYLDVVFLIDLAGQFEEDSVRRARIIRALYQSINVFAENRANLTQARAIIAPVLASQNSAAALTAITVGHAHIDTGWLWRIRETRRKTARTFASQIANIERYPGYVFGASQAQLYQFVKETYPELYAKIKKAMAAGTWEVQGGMWVEADCNLISGESMVRQFVHGKNFFRDEFGVDVKNLWLPDVFGYSANLPQMLKRSGINFFLTQKLSWSQFNTFRYNSFIWQGIDGSSVITHFPPEDNYNSMLTPAAQRKAERNFKEKDRLDEFLTLVGIGDGGGGPKEEHIESGLRLADCEGLPRTVFGRADAFFDRLAQHAGDLETYVGELYLELHRATYTTQARTKRFNRLLENRLRQTEALLTMLPLKEYPREQLDKVWKMLLTNQFHDIIPGSSIHAVYEDAEAAYAQGLAECQALVSAAAPKLFPQDSQALTLVNVLSYPYQASIELPAAWQHTGVARADGKPLAVQQEAGKTVVRTEIAPFTSVALVRTSVAPAPAPNAADLTLENELVRYGFANDGTLAEAYDKEAQRPIMLPDTKANVFSLYADLPNNWDAWDFDFNYAEQLQAVAQCVSIKKAAAGPVRGTLALAFTIGNSRIEQTVSLDGHSKCLTFKTRVHWDEMHRMLRVAFPVNVRSSEASFDIQYGYVKRPTHTNTSWEFAQFEVVGHRYADLSENDYGVALLNDCKYGYKVRGNVLDLNLLRSPHDPDPDADLGEHEFTYALLPHTGALIDANVMAAAEQLNITPLVLDNCRAANAAWPVTVSGEGLSLTVLKKAEKEECLAVRIVETLGKTSSGALHAAGRVVETNLLEWTDGKPSDVKGEMPVTLRPFEIRTYKVFPG